jgi:hypothetical protein
MIRKIVNNSRILVILIVLILSLSCGYHYVSYLEQAKVIEDEKISIQNQFDDLTWFNIETLIGAIQREGNIQANAAAIILKDNIFEQYPNLDELKSDFDTGNYNPTRFNKILIKTIPQTSFMGNFDDRNGIIVATDKKIMYNLMVRHDSIDNSWDEFIEANYNKALAKRASFYLHSRSPLLNIIEPHPPMTTHYNHYMIDDGTVDNLRKVYIREGLQGLYGYVILCPVYVTPNGDIFNTPDYNDQGVKANNHKMMIISCISIYDTIVKYHMNNYNMTVNLKRNILEAKEAELVQLYYSSICFVLINLIVMLSLIGITKYIRSDN